MSNGNEPAAQRARGTGRAFRWLLVCGAVPIIATTLGASEARPARAAFPGQNGRYVAYQSIRDGRSQIYVATVPPTSVRRITTFAHCYALPAWSPDGRWLAFEYNPSPSGARAGASDIAVINPFAKQPLSTFRLLTRTLGFDGDPVWSPTGRQIAFESTRSGNSDIWVMSADGRGLKNLTADSPKFDGDPSWSPGGNRIAFTSDRDGNKEIYLMDAVDGKGLVNITNNRADDFDPTWSPDGQLVGFVSNRDGNDEIYATNDRFLLQRLTHDPGLDAFPDWSPDGRSIVFASDRGDAGNRDLHTMSSNGDGNGVTDLVQLPGWDQAPDWQKRGLPAAGIFATHPVAGPPRKVIPSDLQPAVACRGNST
jgi:TolB protein